MEETEEIERNALKFNLQDMIELLCHKPLVVMIVCSRFTKDKPVKIQA